MYDKKELEGNGGLGSNPQSTNKKVSEKKDYTFAIVAGVIVLLTLLAIVIF